VGGVLVVELTQSSVEPEPADDATLPARAAAAAPVDHSKEPSMSHVRRTTLLMMLGILVTTALAVAHDFWLVPDAFQVAADGELVLRGHTSSAFPTSESAVTPDRVTSARIVGATDEETISALSTQDRSLVLGHRPRTAGQKIVAASVGWRHLKETAASFRKYLVLEGAADALARYDRAGQLPTGAIVRRYAKYAKTAVEVGEGPRAYQREAGQPLEFVPLTDPSDVRSSSELRFRLLFQGQPLAGALVHAGIAPARGKPATADLNLTTSDEGIVSVRVGPAGLWNVRTIHVLPAPAGADADWDVHWATFVFAVE